VGNLLETVADSQNGNTQLEKGGIDVRSVLLVDRVGTTGKNDALGLPGQIRKPLGTWQHLRVDIDLSQTAGNEVSTVEDSVR
jgi:hypothetical protein